jgi:hypothetical protein
MMSHEEHVELAKEALKKVIYVEDVKDREAVAKEMISQSFESGEVGLTITVTLHEDFDGRLFGHVEKLSNWTEKEPIEETS